MHSETSQYQSLPTAQQVLCIFVNLFSSFYFTFYAAGYFYFWKYIFIPLFYSHYISESKTALSCDVKGKFNYSVSLLLYSGNKRTILIVIVMQSNEMSSNPGYCTYKMLKYYSTLSPLVQICGEKQTRNHIPGKTL